MMVGGCRVHRVKRLFKAASTDISFRVLGVFKRLAKQADLIHYHFPYPLADIAHFYSKPQKPTVVTYHSDIIAQKKLGFFYRPLMNRFLGDVSAIVGTSPDYIDSSPVLQRFKSKTRCIPLGITASSVIDSQLAQEWKQKLPERFFLFIGAFRYYKGLDCLLSAAKGFGGQIVLLGSGSLKSKLEARVIEDNIPNVHFLGSLPDRDKEAVLSLCQGLVLPSNLRSEAFGLALLEGARCGKPLICCDIGSGMSYVNIHKQTGFLVPAGDPQALREALTTLWDDAALAGRLGAQAKERFEKLFTQEKMVASYLELYQELLSGKKPV
jgi:rhamnosyl/mannosyltransferase